MPEEEDTGSTLIIARHWSDGSELSSVTRAVAGASTRFSEVTVLVPGQTDVQRADGAFDLLGIDFGGMSNPTALAGRLGRPLTAFRRVIVDQCDDLTSAAIAALDSSTPVFVIAPPAPRTGAGDHEHLRFLPGPPASGEWLGMQVPVNPLAATHRHNGLGFTGYILVLSDRVAAEGLGRPTDSVAWITASLPQAHVVVVEDGAAAVWQGRALRGIVGVESRMDFWRLLAHAQCVVDLAAGPIIAQECVESLRFGIPIVVPTMSAAAAHALAGGGLVYRDVDSMVAALDQMADPLRRSAHGATGKVYADTYFGNAGGFVQRLRHCLTHQAAG